MHDNPIINIYPFFTSKNYNKIIETIYSDYNWYKDTIEKNNLQSSKHLDLLASLKSFHNKKDVSKSEIKLFNQSLL